MVMFIDNTHSIRYASSTFIKKPIVSRARHTSINAGMKCDKSPAMKLW